MRIEEARAALDDNQAAREQVARSSFRPGEVLSFKERLARLLGRVIFYSLLVLIGLVAVPYGTVEPWWEALFEVIVFTLGSLWTIEGLLSRRWLAKEHSIFLPLLVLALYAFIQTLQIFPGAAAAQGLKVWNAISADPFETRLSVLKLLALILSGVLLLRYTTNHRRLRTLIFTLIAVGFLSAFFGILRQTAQHSQGFFLPFLKPDAGYGQFINRNHFAYLMEMVLGLTLGLIVARGIRREHVLIYLALALPVWTALILCNSRGGILSMLAQSMFLALIFTLAQPKRAGREREEHAEASIMWRISHTRAFRFVLVIALVATVFLGALWIGGEALSTRLETVSSEVMEGNIASGGAGRKDIWRATWRMIKDHPLLGVGFNGYWATIPEYHEASGELTPQQAHNDYLELMASGGIIGLLLAGWFLFLLIKSISRSFQAQNSFRRAASMAACAGLFGVVVHSAFDFGLHITINALIFTALIVISIAGTQTAGRKSDERVISLRS